MPPTAVVETDGAQVQRRAQERRASRLLDLRRRLEQQRNFRLEQLAELDAAAEGYDQMGREAVGSHSCGSSALHEVAALLAAGARHALADIEVALASMAAGRYGRCQACHAEIPQALLEAIPESRLCLDCRHLVKPAPGHRLGFIRGL